MKLYHGSNMIISAPDARHSKPHLDFGPGFYATSYKDQAATWAKRKAARLGGVPTVSSYELSEYLDTFRVLRFETELQWLDFVCGCRKGSDDNKYYDVIIGRVADDKVYAAVDMYLRGYWDAQRTIEELSFYEDNDQYCFVNNRAINALLSFEDAYEVRP